ncbi:hypothetical protein N0B44_29655 [Roseibacterium beibuensis]|uniref:hypothetical protein n=1 Tax=[Roseibacterium] beibuensis TaxID=1193142 RepID=UPI00217CF25D|nr:hypothetical protein [Roseibacterium beibuensis]MCS6627087.1 hypothetical protein [Roseibacterium beibuensis]
MSPNPTPALLSGLADELSLMIPVVEGLSALVFDHALNVGPGDRPGVLTQAQAVDDLSQRLEALRDLVGALSRGVEAGAALDAMPLAAVADRLRAAAIGGGPVPAGGTDAGDLLLFG